MYIFLFKCDGALFILIENTFDVPMVIQYYVSVHFISNNGIKNKAAMGLNSFSKVTIFISIC